MSRLARDADIILHDAFFKVKTVWNVVIQFVSIVFSGKVFELPADDAHLLEDVDLPCQTLKFWESFSLHSSLVFTSVFQPCKLLLVYFLSDGADLCFRDCKT